jgi:hypothetical protein
LTLQQKIYSEKRKKMNLEVRRNRSTIRSTTGKLSIDSQLQCVTLEPPLTADPNGNGYVCIPAGTFPLTIQWSPKFQRQVPHVNDVPGRSAIEIHIGNFPDDTDGCTLVGMDYGDPIKPDYIRLSAVAFAALMTKLYAGSVLNNPDSPEVDQVWNVGTIAYLTEPITITT